MKTVILKFQHFTEKRPKVNQCVVSFEPASGDTPPQITGLFFQEPVRKMSYAQFFELNEQIQNSINEAVAADPETSDMAPDQSAENPENLPQVKLGDFGKALVKKGGVKDLVTNMKKMMDNGQIPMSQEEKSEANQAFSLIGKLLGYDKKK